MVGNNRKHTESSLIWQTIHRLQSIHCQRIVRIFLTNFSEYCKHEGCPGKNQVLFDMKIKNYVPEFPHSAQLIIFSGIPLAFFSLSPKQNPQIPIGFAIF